MGQDRASVWCACRGNAVPHSRVEPCGGTLYGFGSARGTAAFGWFDRRPALGELPPAAQRPCRLPEAARTAAGSAYRVRASGVDDPKRARTQATAGEGARMRVRRTAPATAKLVTPSRGGQLIQLFTLTIEVCT